ncbi:PLP-dependent aminotransferase family protein [Sorangium sp. So ce1182]|uniref:MocR-like pyridoxine biosynthesis transcription factor PdxR n=1 Tax=Sorangium sp. So ce1182 TaxID=3133334 RepID=UPI003F5FDB29
MPWELSLAVDPAAPQPIFLQIARALSDDIRRGRLRAGAELPGSRALARSLSVHRNTVLAAYRELAAEGWIEASAARGTFVAAELPSPSPRRFARRAAARAEVPARLGFDLGATSLRPMPLVPPDTLRMSGGLPDMRLVPTAELARAYRRALRAEPQRLLDYADPRGNERLRAALAAMLSAVRGLAAGPESVLVTRGSQMAIDLVARALLAPGDAVAVESYGYRPAWEALRLGGARLVPVPVDAAGLSVDALTELADRERLRAVYVTPHHQYPTTAVLAPGRRVALLELCRRRRIALIEDDYDHEFHYDGRPVLPLASADAAGVVVHVGTLSKILAPGLRLGFVVAPEPLIERLSLHRTFVDRQGDHAVERAVAELLEDGEVQRHAQRARRVYRARRDLLVEALRARLGGALDFRVPAGGMALWAKVDAAIDADAWAERSLERKVAFSPGRRYAFDGRKRPFLRLGFAALDEEEIRDAVERMARAL